MSIHAVDTVSTTPFQPSSGECRGRLTLWLGGLAGLLPLLELGVKKGFGYQAGSWKIPRRVVAKVEWHSGEIYPRVRFIVTNITRPAERVVASGSRSICRP